MDHLVKGVLSYKKCISRLLRLLQVASTKKRVLVLQSLQTFKEFYQVWNFMSDRESYLDVETFILWLQTCWPFYWTYISLSFILQNFYWWRLWPMPCHHLCNSHPFKARDHLVKGMLSKKCILQVHLLVLLVQVASTKYKVSVLQWQQFVKSSFLFSSLKLGGISSFPTHNRPWEAFFQSFTLQFASGLFEIKCRHRHSKVALK